MKISHLSHLPIYCEISFKWTVLYHYGEYIYSFSWDSNCCEVLFFETSNNSYCYCGKDKDVLPDLTNSICDIKSFIPEGYLGKIYKEKHLWLKQFFITYFANNITDLFLKKMFYTFIYLFHSFISSILFSTNKNIYKRKILKSNK